MHAAQELGHGGDFGLAPGVAGRLVGGVVVGLSSVDQGSLLRSETVTVRLLDLRLERAASGDAVHLDVVIPGNRDSCGFGTVRGDVDEHQDVRVVAADILIPRVQRVIHLRRKGLTLLVDPRIQAHDQDVRVLAQLRHRLGLRLQVLEDVRSVDVVVHRNRRRAHIRDHDGGRQGHGRRDRRRRDQEDGLAPGLVAHMSGTLRACLPAG